MRGIFWGLITDYTLKWVMMVTYTLNHRDTALREIRASEKQLAHSDICHVILIEVRDEKQLEGLLELLQFRAASVAQAMEGLLSILVGRAFTLSHLHRHSRANIKAGNSYYNTPFLLTPQGKKSRSLWHVFLIFFSN